jgi:peptidoglycan/xylan/chitin deacetylase (PgdA/CDA1 family)
MFSRPRINGWTKRALLGSGVFRAAANLRPPATAILMYHSVVPDPPAKVDIFGDIAHEENAFRRQMELLARGYSAISLDDAVMRLRTAQDLPRRSIVVTFDDGYADNCEVTMPILNKFGIPATFYVTVECIEKRILPWPARLRYALSKTTSGSCVDDTGKSWPLLDSAMRQRFFAHACETACRLAADEREGFLLRLLRTMRVELPHELGSLMMTQEQLRTLMHHGHIIGSHTMTHPNLAHVRAADARWELSESKQRLESVLNSPVKHFAYPCPALSPHWNERTFSQCAEIGYESAATTDNGVARRGKNPLCLPRVRPTKTVEGLRWNLERAFAGLAAE